MTDVEIGLIFAAVALLTAGLVWLCDAVKGGGT
jgi:hypothetical protein